MSDLLFEIGTEELPASFIQPALRFLEETLAKELKTQRLSFDKIQAEDPTTQGRTNKKSQ